MAALCEIQFSKHLTIVYTRENLVCNFMGQKRWLKMVSILNILNALKKLSVGLAQVGEHWRDIKVHSAGV